MNSKENQRTKLTKMLFKNAMINLLEKKSLYDITVTELCQNAELNRSTFYNYYNNVNDVFIDIEQELMLASEEYIQKINKIEFNSIAKPLYQLLNYIKENIKVYKLLLNNHISEEFSQNIMKKPIDFLKEKIKTLNIELGGDTDYIFTYIVSGSLEIIKKWVNSNMKESPQYIDTLIYKLSSNILGLKNDEIDKI